MPDAARVRIVTDSTADIPPELRERYGIVTVPLTVQFGTDVYRDGMDLSAEEFFARQAAGPFPTTAQPPVGAFEAAYRQLQAEGATGVCAIIFSSKLSGTYNAALLAANDLAGALPIAVIDSLLGSMGVGYLAIEAAKVAETGASLDAVCARVRALMPAMEVLFLLETLKYLEKGGRINKAKSLLGSVLAIKPLLRLVDGEVVPFRQPRTRAKGLDALIAWITEFPDPVAIALCYDGTPAMRPEIEAVAERIAATVPRARITITPYSQIYAVHAGPRGIAVIVFKRV